MVLSPRVKKLLAKEQKRAMKRQGQKPPAKPLMLNLKERIDKGGKGKGSSTPPKPAPLLNEQDKPKQLTQTEQKPADVPAKGKTPAGGPTPAPLVTEQKPPKQLSMKKEPALSKPKNVTIARKRGVIASLRKRAAKVRAESVPF